MTLRLLPIDREEYSPDGGCAAGGPSCLRCRLPQCIYDDTPEERLRRRQQRDAAIVARYRTMRGNVPGQDRIALVAREFGVSKRTVCRAIERAQEER